MPWAVAGALALLTVAVGYRALDRGDSRAAADSAEPSAWNVTEPTQTRPPVSSEGYLYGRVTTVDGATYEGRLRWGGVEEAFWDDYFHGERSENEWLPHVPAERLPTERRPIEIFGLRVAERERELDLGRPFLARFGDLARIEARGDEVRVTLKSGSVVDLDRFDASDFDDDVRVWDRARGVVDLESLRIRAIELLPTPPLADAPYRPHGTVRTRAGDFTGFVAWNRFEAVGSDELDGRRGLRLDSLRSIARHSHRSSLVTMLDGRELVVADTAEVGDGNHGIYVVDPRYGRVLVPWSAFERVDFDVPGERPSGAGYDDYAPGRPLAGSVATRDGRRFAGRLVFDLDESETTETLDAPSQGLDYTIPFGLVAAIVPADGDERGAAGAVVTLHGGETLQFEGSGDLGGSNAGLLIFVAGAARPEYVPWPDVARIDFDPPPIPDSPGDRPAAAD